MQAPILKRYCTVTPTVHYFFLTVKLMLKELLQTGAIQLELRKNTV